MKLKEDTIRLWDLARYFRGELHDAELITSEEYVELACDTKSYDRMKARDIHKYGNKMGLTGNEN
jgi:hypothetical protein